MNYQALKGMLESVVKTYKCPNCTSLISEENVDIVGAAGSTINIDIECPNCGKHSMIKAEMTQIDLSKMSFNPDSLPILKDSLEKIKENLLTNKGSTNKIKDEEIVSLSKDLKNKELKISDFIEL